MIAELISFQIGFLYWSLLSDKAFSKLYCSSGLYKVVNPWFALPNWSRFRVSVPRLSKRSNTGGRSVRSASSIGNFVISAVKLPDASVIVLQYGADTIVSGIFT